MLHRTTTTEHEAGPGGLGVRAVVRRLATMCRAHDKCPPFTTLCSVVVLVVGAARDRPIRRRHGPISVLPWSLAARRLECLAHAPRIDEGFDAVARVLQVPQPAEVWTRD